jgi:hypothetical protein
MNSSLKIKRIAGSFLRVLPLLLLSGPALTVLVHRANAQQAPSWYDPEQRGAKVMGHVPLDVSNFKDAVFRESEGRRYLYVQNSGSRQVTIIDVTSRRKPKILGSIDLPTDARLSDVSFKGDVAIVSDVTSPAAVSTTQPSTTRASSENITIWDLSKPDAPQVSQRFTGVRKVIPGRSNAVYVVDSRGLWIVQIYNQEMRDWDYYVDHIGG